MTYTLERCNNEDSCEPGTTHKFPDPGTFVVLTCTEARIVGSDEFITITPGQQAFVTEDAIPEAHQVAVAINEDHTFWVDVDDDIKEIA